MISEGIVSVVIPVYNSETFLEACLNSVVSQTYDKIEIILVDDGSADRSIDIANKFNVRVISQKKNGACSARNRGYFESKGDYIQFLDADDLLSPNKIEVQMKQLIGQHDIISNGRWGRFYTANPLVEDIRWGPHESLEKDLGPVSWLCQNRMSQTACWLTPRKLIEKAGPWDESLSINQDGEFFSRVVAQSKQVLYCPEAKVYYRSQLKNSITSKAKSDKAILSKFKTCESFKNVLLNLENSARTRLACANKYQEFVYGAFPKQMELIKKAEQRIEELGGSDWPRYPAGQFAELSDKYLGWKTTAWLKHLTGR